MTDIVERLRFDALRCETQFSRGVAGNIEDAAAEIERLRALLRRHQVAAWCEEDSDLAVETRRALETKP